MRLNPARIPGARRFTPRPLAALIAVAWALPALAQPDRADTEAAAPSLSRVEVVGARASLERALSIKPALLEADAEKAKAALRTLGDGDAAEVVQKS